MNKTKTKNSSSVKEFKKEFFSKENFLMLYKVLNSSVQKNYNQNMSKDDKSNIADIMKEIYDSNIDFLNNKDLSLKDNRDSYISKFNKKLLDNVLPELSKKYKSINENNLIEIHKVNDRPTNTNNRKDNIDLNKKFNELLENRSINNAPKQSVSFEDEEYIAVQKNKNLRNKNTSKNRGSKDKISNISSNIVDVNNESENVKSLSDYFNQPKLDSKNKELTKFYEENDVNDILEETLKQRASIIEPNNKPDKKTLEAHIHNNTNNTNNTKEVLYTPKKSVKNTMPELPKNNLEFNNNTYSNIENNIINNDIEINTMNKNVLNYNNISENISENSENVSELLNELTTAESVVSYDNFNENDNEYESADNFIFGADLNPDNVDNEVDNYVENLDYNLEKNKLSKEHNNNLNNDDISDSNSVNDIDIYAQLEKDISISHKFSNKLEKLNNNQSNNQSNNQTNNYTNKQTNNQINNDLKQNYQVNNSIDKELFTSLNNTINNLNSSFVDYKQSMVDYQNQNNDNITLFNNNFNDYNQKLSNLLNKNHEKATNNNELIKVVLEEINDNILANKQHYNSHQNILNNNLKNLENLNANFETFSNKMDVLFNNITKKLDNNLSSQRVEKIQYNSSLKHNILDNPNNVSFKLDNKYKQIKFDKIIIPKSLVNNYINKYVKLYFRIYSDTNNNIKTIEYDVSIDNDDQFYYLINNENNYIELELNQSINYYINLSLFDYMNRPININNDYLKALTIMNVYLDENNEKISGSSINNNLVLQSEDNQGTQIYKNVKKYSLIKFERDFRLRENCKIKLNNFKINLEENNEQKNNSQRNNLLIEKEKIFNNITKIEKINTPSSFIVDFNLDDISFNNLGILTYDSINVSYILSGIY